MKGFRFYLEHKNTYAKRRRQHSGNVFAAFACNGWFIGASGGTMMGGIGALCGYPNSPVCSTAAQDEYLRKNCRRISERLARQIHPALFARLDQDNQREGIN